MIRLYFLIMLLLVSSVVSAQQANPLPIVQQKMQALQWAVGKWQGPVYLTNESGKQEFKQTVFFAPKIKNTVLLLNEAAFLGQDTIFQNIGVLNYDALQSKYTLRAYTNGGPQVDADVEVKDKQMLWRIQIPGTMVRYTIRLNERG